MSEIFACLNFFRQEQLLRQRDNSSNLLFKSLFSVNTVIWLQKTCFQCVCLLCAGTAATMAFLVTIRECDTFLVGCGVCACGVGLRALKIIGENKQLESASDVGLG